MELQHPKGTLPQMTQTENESAPQTRWVTRWLWGAVILLLLYALIPAMTRSHLEGFTYLTETMSASRKLTE